ncbi:TlpA family protein disulfide reductase [Aliarcobacter butzleri]
MKVFRLLFLIIVLKGVAFAAPFLEDILKKDKINIVAFVTSWCPVCQKTNDYLESFSKKNSDVFVTLFFVDEEVPKILSLTSNFKTNSISFEDSKKFGVDKSVPYILVFDKELKVIKKYNSFNELLLTKLIKNLQQGLYENGTLPPEQRIDLWQKNRF